jgi:hydroxymethylglutaryl-CoA reductase
MRNRGGGIKDIQIINKTYEEPNYYQLSATFETKDAIGANFINSCLEQFAQTLKREILDADEIADEFKDITIIMCILSNYTPECIVRAEVSCPIDQLTGYEGMSPEMFAHKFEQAIHVARIEPYRATTHNKGIFNGIDSVVLATGNDFRAVEASGHTYASRTGQYRSLSDVTIDNGTFNFFLEIPISVGTVGGITTLHPMVKLAHKILNNPNAEQLMMIIATAGLAQNYGAVSSLVTTGIQRGHMKMHLLNILNQLEATDDEKAQIVKYFITRVVTFPAVTEVFTKIRGGIAIDKQDQ